MILIYSEGVVIHDLLFELLSCGPSGRVQRFFWGRGSGRSGFPSFENDGAMMYAFIKSAKCHRWHICSFVCRFPATGEVRILGIGKQCNCIWLSPDILVKQRNHHIITGIFRNAVDFNEREQSRGFLCHIRFPTFRGQRNSSLTEKFYCPPSSKYYTVSCLVQQKYDPEKFIVSCLVER